MNTQFKFAALLTATLVSAAGSAQTLPDAMRFIDNEQYEKAKQTLQQLLMKEPANGESYFYMGDVYMKQEETDSAGMFFEKGTKMNPTNPLVHVGLGRFYMYTGKNAEGAKELANAEAMITTQAKTIGKTRLALIYTEMAETYTFAQQGDYDKAISYTQLAQKQDPQYPDALLARGDAQAKKDVVNKSEAIKSYNEAAALDPKSCKANLRIGMVYLNADNPDAAIEAFDKAIATEPNFAPGWRNKGEALYRKGQFEKGAECYRRYLELNDDPYWRYRYVALLYLNKQYQNAVSETERIWQKDTSILVLYRLMGFSQYELATYDPALMNINKFLVRATERGTPKILYKDYETRGRIYQKLNKDSLALLDFEKAYQMDTSRKELFGDIAATYLKSKRYDLAVVWYEKKIRSSNTSNINDQNAYARSLYFVKNYAKADSIYNVMMVSSPKTATTYYWRGRCYSAQLEDKTQQVKARPFYEQFVALAIADKVKNKKDLITACGWLGGYYAEQKNYACAKAFYQLILELDPENANAKSVLEQAVIKNATAAELNTCYQQPMLLPQEAKDGAPNGQ
jgi:tetratricopeptide (TPR) repeat protein